MPISTNIDGKAPSKRAKRRHRRDEAEPEYPAFLVEYPKDVGLASAVDAFVKGNYRETRRLCNALLERELDPEVHAAARDLLRRLMPDRLITGILWGSFVLLALIVLWAYGQ
jgi:hypothetical protein